MPTSEAYAPYNFIPFYSGIVPPDREQKGLPAFNRKTKDTVSGVISYQMEFLTPVIAARYPQEGEENGAFFRDAQGHMCLPGSSLRGHIRTNCEILSLSAPDEIEDQTFLFRSVADSCPTLQEQYNERIKGNNNHTLPKGIYAGEIKHEGDDYWMYMLKTINGHPIIRLKENDLEELQFKLEKDERFSEAEIHGENYIPFRKACYFTADPNGYVKSIRIADNKKKPGELRGMLIGSGQIEKKKSYYLVSAEHDGNRIKIELNTIENYKNDLEINIGKKNSGGNAEKVNNFYRLPDRGDGKIFFYIYDKNRENIRDFGATPYMRLHYNHSISAGMKNVVRPEKGLDYVHAMFGQIGETLSDSRKTRVYFENAVLTNPNETKIEPVSLLLAGPSAKSYKMYLEQPDITGRNTKTYNDSNFKLRGYKFYWKRGKETTERPVSTKADAATSEEEKNQNISSHFEKLGGHPVFQGRIRFENLYEDELGLLLMALRVHYDKPVEETQSIGSGKPYGFGKFRFKGIALQVIDDEKRFTSVTPEMTDMTAKAEKYCRSFRNRINEYLETGLYENQKSIQIYYQYLQCSDADGYLQGKTYMPLQPLGGDDNKKNYRNADPLPSAETIMRNLNVKIDTTESSKEENDDFIMSRVSVGTVSNHSYIFAVPPKGASKPVLCHINQMQPQNMEKMRKLRKGDLIYYKLDSNMKVEKWHI